MTRFNQILVALLSAQLVIALAIFMNKQGPGVEHHQTILPVEKAQLFDQIIIETEEDGQLLLEKSDSQWRLAKEQLPAKQVKVEQLINTLSNTGIGWPVTTSSSSHERFEVAEDNYQSKITISKGDEPRLTLYLGTSPGFRQLHIRKNNDDEVYAAKLNSHDFPAKVDSWLDTALLRPKGEITSLQGPNFTLNRQGGGWQLAEQPGELNLEQVNKLSSSLAQLQVQGVTRNQAAKEQYALTVKAAGKTLNYRFFHEDDSYYVARNDYEQSFKITQSDYDNIASLRVEQLLQKTTKQEKNSS